VIDERPHQGLGLLIAHDRDLGPPRVLQTRRRKVDALPRPIEEAHVDLSEIVLRELPREDPRNRTSGRTRRLRVVTAWALVSVPLACGVYQTLLKSLALFS
jgi:hypothetical protein